MEYSATQIFDISIIAFAIICVFATKLATIKCMPAVNAAYNIPGHVSRVLVKSKWRLIAHTPFILFCVCFCVCRAIVFLYSVNVEAWAAWIACIIAGLYAANTLIFHAVFRVIAKSVVSKPLVSQG